MIIVMSSLSNSSVIKMYVGVFNFFRFKSVFKKLFLRGDGRISEVDGMCNCNWAGSEISSSLSCVCANN